MREILKNWLTSVLFKRSVSGGSGLKLIGCVMQINTIFFHYKISYRKRVTKMKSLKVRDDMVTEK